MDLMNRESTYFVFSSEVSRNLIDININKPPMMMRAKLIWNDVMTYFILRSGNGGGGRNKQGQFINLLIAGKFNIQLWPLFGQRTSCIDCSGWFLMPSVNTTISVG